MLETEISLEQQPGRNKNALEQEKMNSSKERLMSILSALLLFIVVSSKGWELSLLISKFKHFLSKMAKTLMSLVSNPRAWEFKSRKNEKEN